LLEKNTHFCNTWKICWIWQKYLIMHQNDHLNQYHLKDLREVLKTTWKYNYPLGCPFWVQPCGLHYHLQRSINIIWTLRRHGPRFNAKDHAWLWNYTWLIS
jgi:hypothetical protein